ncbi:MAG: phosphoglycerate dehydrogenase [Myxococcales bacterium]|nr:phosphoglycerate dehydrogenase [Myxococcales bacterium]
MTSRPATSFPKSQIQILLLENIHASAQAAFEREGFSVKAIKGALSEASLCEAITDVHVLGIRSKTQVTPAVLAAAPRLLSIGAFCIGTNQIDLAAAAMHGVPAFNAPFSNTRSVAELILAEIVALARQLGDRNAEVHRGEWKKVSAGCYEIRGKTLGIIGYGHIGGQVGVLAEAFGMRVVYYDIAKRLPLGNVRHADTLAEVLGQSDFVTLHVPETPQTHRMIGAAELAAMKPGGYLLNASRGTVVDIDALAAALTRGHLAGAAVDVYPKEPETNAETFESPLRGLPNVILTPHVGGSTEEAQAAIGLEVSASLLGFINAGHTAGAVNFPQVELPPSQGAHRILNVHRNVPGVLGAINKIVSDLGANIRSQVLATNSDIGYLAMDLEHNVSDQVRAQIAALPTNIKTRILY